MLNSRKYSYQYDAAGNPVKRTISPNREWHYIWDTENQLIEAKLVHNQRTKRTVTFKYDPFGRRIEKKVQKHHGPITDITTREYLYDGEDILAEYRSNQIDTGTTFEMPNEFNTAFEALDIEVPQPEFHSHTHPWESTVTKYIHGPGIDEPLAMHTDRETYYYHADGLGSIVALTNEHQYPMQSYKYDSFGRIKIQHHPFLESPYAFTGREWDKEIGLYYYRARYYDPVEGRFITRDPIGFGGRDVNLYRYVKNNAIVLTDPFGLISKEDVFNIIKTTFDYIVPDSGVNTVASAALDPNTVKAFVWAAVYNHNLKMAEKGDCKNMIDSTLVEKNPLEALRLLREYQNKQ